jgi:uncharacterized protein YciI
MTLPPVEGFVYHFMPTKPLETWTPDDEATAERHYAYLKKATDEGQVLLAGRSLDSEGPAFVIFEAGSDEEARRFMESDPFVAGGLMQASLHPFRAALIRDASA